MTQMHIMCTECTTCAVPCNILSNAVTHISDRWLPYKPVACTQCITHALMWQTHQSLHPTVDRPTPNHEVSESVQAVWSSSSPHTCAVITQDSRLLNGHLGTEELQAVAGVKHAACVTWSPDGQLLAYGWGDKVHVHNTRHSVECWSTQIASQDLQVGTVAVLKALRSR